MIALLRLAAWATLFKVLLLAPAAADAQGAAAPLGGGAEPLAFVCARTEAALARPELAAYRGWLKYLRHDAQVAAERKGADLGGKIARLSDWLGRITANPGLLASLSGVQEWAYESPVDDSGQPFRLAIPTDYNSSHPAPLTVYMHGYSGNHIEHSDGMASHPGSFDVAVLGRSRGGGYRCLSEADVLQVVDYIEAHWSIDLSRVSLNGGSMGGGGTYRLGSRYPQRWSSGRPSCGFASYVPVGNLLTFPIYATHSADDPVVSVLEERGPLANLRSRGGQVIFDETNGYGHAVWDYKEGNLRGKAWEDKQVLPDSKSIRHIDYTALDGTAVRGWWAEVAEWGPLPRAARFILTAGADNQLYAQLTNITRLRLLLAESPLDPKKTLEVSVNGGLPLILPSPLPQETVLSRGENGWAFESAAPSLPFRLHTPGAASLLYDGEPLLIVYGTQGTEAERAALRRAALSASKSPIPAWVADGGESGTDGVPHSQNLYGWLNTKADRDVTERDIERCHLVLIGSASQNSLVSRIADALPVRFSDGQVSFSDGTSLRGPHQALGLVHYNPLAPGRLIFWVASDDPASYAPGSLVPLLMGGGGRIYGTAFPADLVVVSSRSPTLVAARSFDSRWHWNPRSESSPLVPAAVAPSREFSVAVGEAVRKVASCDLALVTLLGAEGSPMTTVATTRLSDLEPFFLNEKIGLFVASGAELEAIAKKVAAKDSGWILTGYDPAKVVPDKTYRVALPVGGLWSIHSIVSPAPLSYQLTDLTAADAIAQYLAAP